MLSEREAFRQIDLQRQSDELAAKRRAEEASPATHPAGQSRVRTYAAAHPSSHNDARTPHAQMRRCARLSAAAAAQRARAQAAKEEARQAYKASVVAAKKKAEETEESRLRQARESAPLVATRRHRLSRLPTERGQLPLHRAEQCVDGCCGGRERF